MLSPTPKATKLVSLNCRAQVIQPPEDLDFMHRQAWYTKDAFIGQVFDVNYREKNGQEYYFLLHTKNNYRIINERLSHLSYTAKNKFEAIGPQALTISGKCCKVHYGTKNKDFKYLLMKN